MSAADIACILFVTPLIIGLWVLAGIGVLYLWMVARDMWRGR